jgi:hypothetical protein
VPRWIGWKEMAGCRMATIPTRLLIRPTGNQHFRDDHSVIRRGAVHHNRAECR